MNWQANSLVMNKKRAGYILCTLLYPHFMEMTGVEPVSKTPHQSFLHVYLVFNTNQMFKQANLSSWTV